VSRASIRRRGSRNLPPHLVGEALLKHFGFGLRSREAPRLYSLDFARAAERYGKWAASPILRARSRSCAQRRASLLLDGGDTGRIGTSLGRRGQDMIEAQNPKCLSKAFADQMRRKFLLPPTPRLNARLTEAQRQKLRVAIGEVQQRHVAERRQIVESFVLRTRSQGKPGRRRRGERLQEFATRQRHLLTGDSGSSSSATRWVICSSVSTPLWPKRGMLEQAANASAL